MSPHFAGGCFFNDLRTGLQNRVVIYAHPHADFGGIFLLAGREQGEISILVRLIFLIRFDFLHVETDVIDRVDIHANWLFQFAKERNFSAEFEQPQLVGSHFGSGQ